MSIQAIQMRAAQPAESGSRSGASAVAFNGAAAASNGASASRRSQDQVEVSDQARELAARMGQPEVELQLSPARLREMVGKAEAANS
jgi:hypothetical protein